MSYLVVVLLVIGMVGGSNSGNGGHDVCGYNGRVKYGDGDD